MTTTGTFPFISDGWSVTICDGSSSVTTQQRGAVDEAALAGLRRFLEVHPDASGMVGVQADNGSEYYYEQMLLPVAS